MELDTDVSPLWPAADWSALAVRATEAALAVYPSSTPPTIAIRLTDDAELQRLNLQFRHKDSRRTYCLSPQGRTRRPGVISRSPLRPPQPRRPSGTSVWNSTRNI